MKNITWKNTLHNSVRGFGSISDFAQSCVKVGYPYMCWNDRIYAVIPATENPKLVTWNYTGITIDQVNVNSKPHTGIVVVACRDSSGGPTFVYYDIQYTDNEYNEGVHYERAGQLAEDDGYEKPFIFYDKSEVEQITTIAAEIQNYSEP